MRRNLPLSSSRLASCAVLLMGFTLPVSCAPEAGEASRSSGEPNDELNSPEGGGGTFDLMSGGGAEAYSGGATIGSGGNDTGGAVGASGGLAPTSGGANGSGGEDTAAGGADTAAGGARNGGEGSGGETATGGTGGTGQDLIEGPLPLGDGWEEYFPDWDYHVPPNADEYGERYTYEGGVFHLWVEDTDLSTFPGQDSGPRSEVRVRNEYNSGSRQFQADVMLLDGTEKVGIWQLFKRPYPWMVRIYDGVFRQFGNGSSFGEVPFGIWQRFYSIHDTANQTLQVYIDGELVVDEAIGGSEIDYYNKFGVYGREGMGALNEIYFKNVHFFRKD